ncbi:MAG: mandelate racemase/muconate lactonizing enzyme family protein, partial [Pseudomonadota bacterium]
KLETDNGLAGWGEFAPLGSWYSAAFTVGARAGLQELLPQLLGEDPCDVVAINARMDDLLNGHPYIKTPIDMACWDIYGKSEGLPLAELSGGRFGDSVLLYRSVSQAEPSVMVEQAKQYVAEGYTRLQVKVGDDPETDSQRMNAVRSAVGDDIQLLADANGAWGVEAAARFVELMGDADYRLEQPCMSMRENAAVYRQTQRTMILDESIETHDDLLDACDAGVVNGITIKLSRVGGISKARDIRDTAVSKGLQVCIEDTGGSDIDTAATTHLMLSTPEASRSHTVDFMNWVTVSNANGMPPTRNGRVAAPRGAGLGLEVLESAFDAALMVFE